MAVARWAVFPNLLAWELMNEAHLTPRYDDEDIIRWHSEMARAIKEADLYHHLVTASVDDSLARIWRDPAIDFTTAHLYGPDLTSLVNRDRVRGLRYPKPFWIQEIGRSVSAGGENADPLGRHLHHALWLSWMTPAAGCAMPWWWDTQIQRLHLYPHFAALSAFDRGEERRGGGFRCWTLAVTGEGNAAVSVQLLAGRTAAYGFVYSPETVRDPSLAPRDPLIAGGRRLALEGLMDGAYELEFWDTYSGVVADRRKASCEGGRILIDLPPGRADFAFKLKAVSRRELGARME
jgi:hypothetical protein